MLPGLLSCGRSDSHTDYSNETVADTLTHHSRYLTIADLGGGVTAVDIADPSDENGRKLARYALVHRDSVVPEGLGNDVRIIRTPVQRAAVFSAVHTGGLEELGAADVVCAVAEGSYFSGNDSVSIRLRRGEIIDVGNAQTPSVELLAASGAEVVLRSPIQGAATAAIPSTIVPVECIDYMETSPIGRAEWMLLLGELTCKRDEARKIFTEVIDSYGELVYKASQSKSARPKVLVENEYGGVWYLPAGGSYMARMIADAGGDYPWADTEGSGSLALSIENVADKALDADVWLLRTFGYTADAASLKAQNARYGAFKAAREGNVYGCDTSVKPLFNDIAFHPEQILADYIAIFHPDALPGYTLKYFSH